LRGCSSFDPADYIIPGRTDESLPYRLLLEINQPGDDQASLVYAVDIDNIDPRTFQLLDLVGYPKREEDDEKGAEVWALYYVDDSYSSALELIDSALLTIERAEATRVPEME
jgi:hypothetical protein